MSTTEPDKSPILGHLKTSTPHPTSRPISSTPTNISIARENDIDTMGSPGPEDSDASRSSVGNTSTNQTDEVVEESSKANRPSESIASSPAFAAESHYIHRQLSRASMSPTLTPLLIPSPAPGSSIPNSAKSFSVRSFHHSNSETDSANEDHENLASSNEGNKDGYSSGMLDSHPQLIMPSIRMPSRRPFTEKGKGMGRLKVLIAGKKATGKSSLIRSILQSCEDIVHVDPLSLQNQSQPRRRKSPSPGSTPSTFNEIYASTKPYPAWCTDISGSFKSSLKASSLGDTILERNLCFVDPHLASKEESADPCSETEAYIKSCMFKSLNVSNMHSTEIFDLLNGNGGPMVDLVLYLIKNEADAKDIECLARFTSLTNVVPIITHSDEYAAEDLEDMKSKILSALCAAGVECISFGEEGDQKIFAVTSATVDDSEVMDASLLMSPDYVQPLRPSDLSDLVDVIFNGDSISRIRYLATQKVVHWWDGIPDSMKARVGTLYKSPPESELALTKVDDHQKREDKFAQVRLARWAKELQRSLQNEKRRYEALARGERAQWLTERLGECIGEAEGIPNLPEDHHSSTSQALAKLTLEASRSTSRPRSQSIGRAPSIPIDPQDPLGLLGRSEDMKRFWWVFCRVAGSFGVIGGVFMLISRARGSSVESATKLVLGSEASFWRGME